MVGAFRLIRVQEQGPPPNLRKVCLAPWYLLAGLAAGGIVICIVDCWKIEKQLPFECHVGTVRIQDTCKVYQWPPFCWQSETPWECQTIRKAFPNLLPNMCLKRTDAKAPFWPFDTDYCSFAVTWSISNVWQCYDCTTRIVERYCNLTEAQAALEQRPVNSQSPCTLKNPENMANVQGWLDYPASRLAALKRYRRIAENGVLVSAAVLVAALLVALAFGSLLRTRPAASVEPAGSSAYIPPPVQPPVLVLVATPVAMPV